MTNKENWRLKNDELLSVFLAMLFLVGVYTHIGIMFLPPMWIAYFIVCAGPVAYIMFMLFANFEKNDKRLELTMHGLFLVIIAVWFLGVIGITTSIVVAITFLVVCPTMLALVITQITYLLMARDHGSKTSA